MISLVLGINNHPHFTESWVQLFEAPVVMSRAIIHIHHPLSGPHLLYYRTAWFCLHCPACKMTNN